MRLSIFWLTALLIIAVPACQCGASRINDVIDLCEMNPERCDAGTPDASVEPVVDGGQTCPLTGRVTGRICAPDQRTWVNGATVSVLARDCNGEDVYVETTSLADGTFTLLDLPPGSWSVHAASGSFKQDTPVVVKSGSLTQLAENQLCVAQKEVQIAVITGAGDRIEDLLDTLNLTYTTYEGDTATKWKNDAAKFLADLSEMKKYDIIFVNCAAAKESGNSIDFGSNSQLIQQNLKSYVGGGGSLYSSDWALMFVVAAAPATFHFATISGQNVAHPLDTQQLMGYAPQTVQAQITDPTLSQFLGKTSVDIAFPRQSGANSLHWGLMTSAPSAQVLVSASGVSTCTTTSCSNQGADRQNVPLAVWAHVRPAGQPGGNVVYTSFHNIAQSGSDVAQILKYLVLHL